MLRERTMNILLRFGMYIFKTYKDILENTKQNIMVFAENRQILDMLKPFANISEKVFTRDNPSPCNSVMFFDYPADKETFENIIRETSPQSIHLMNYDIKYFDDKEFLKTMAGMLKYAYNNNGGKVELRRCASHLGKSISLVEKILELFEECGFLNIKEKTPAYFVVNFHGIDDVSKVLHNPKYSEILNIAEECELFQKSLLEDEIEEVENLCPVV